jgi:hypothetical protein
VTEQEWLECNNPWVMLAFLRDRRKRIGGRARCRKYRHFSCSCCRRIWDKLGKKDQQAIELSEQYADAKLKLVSLPIEASEWTSLHDAVKFAVHCDPRIASHHAANVAYSQGFPLDWSEAKRVKAYDLERQVQANLLRDIFGNPFRHVTLDPSWKTPAVVQLARSLYEERRFEDMPVLADALEEAGCQDATALGHCRGPGPHVRGCWVLDLVLGKE